MTRSVRCSCHTCRQSRLYAGSLSLLSRSIRYKTQNQALVVFNLQALTLRLRREQDIIMQFLSVLAMVIFAGALLTAVYRMAASANTPSVGACVAVAAGAFIFGGLLTGMPFADEPLKAAQQPIVLRAAHFNVEVQKWQDSLASQSAQTLCESSGIADCLSIVEAEASKLARNGSFDEALLERLRETCAAEFQDLAEPSEQAHWTPLTLSIVKVRNPLCAQALAPMV